MTFIFIIEKFSYRTKNTQTKTNELEETKFKELNVSEREKKIDSLQHTLCFAVIARESFQTCTRV